MLGDSSANWTCNHSPHMAQGRGASARCRLHAAARLRPSILHARGAGDAAALCGVRARLCGGRPPQHAARLAARPELRAVGVAEKSLAPTYVMAKGPRSSKIEEMCVRSSCWVGPAMSQILEVQHASFAFLLFHDHVCTAVLREKYTPRDPGRAPRWEFTGEYAF